MSDDTEPALSETVEALEAQYELEHDDDGLWRLGECEVCWNLTIQLIDRAAGRASF